MRAGIRPHVQIVPSWGNLTRVQWDEAHNAIEMVGHNDERIQKDFVAHLFRPMPFLHHDFPSSFKTVRSGIQDAESTKKCIS